MGLLETIQGSEAVYRLGWTLVHTLWVGVGVAALFAIAMLILRRLSANARYLAGCAALLMMVALPAVGFFLISPPATATGIPDATAQATDPQGATLGSPHITLTGAPVGLPLESVEPPAESSPGTSPPGADVDVPTLADTELPGDQTTTASILTRASRALGPSLPWIVLIWAGGVCVLSLWQLGGWVAAGRLKRLASSPKESDLIETVAQLARALRVSRFVRVLESVLVRVPTVVGWVRPVILLPVGLATGLTPEQVRSILAHELAHIRRYDYLVNLLQSLVETLLFYHPAAWFISRRIRAERENCCDDIVVAACGQRLRYAESLLRVAERSLASRRDRRFASALAVGATGRARQLRERIGRLLGAGSEETARLSRTWPIAVLLVGGLVLSVAVLKVSDGSQVIRGRFSEFAPKLAEAIKRGDKKELETLQVAGKQVHISDKMTQHLADLHDLYDLRDLKIDSVWLKDEGKFGEVKIILRPLRDPDGPDKAISIPFVKLAGRWTSAGSTILTLDKWSQVLRPTLSEHGFHTVEFRQASAPQDKRQLEAKESSDYQLMNAELIPLLKRWRKTQPATKRDQYGYRFELLIDTKEEFIALKEGVATRDVFALPGGYEWKVFRTTPDRVRQLQTSVRLSIPHLKQQKNICRELFVLRGAMGDEQGLWLNISPGLGVGLGDGRAILDSGPFPDHKYKPTPDAVNQSMLVEVAPPATQLAQEAKSATAPRGSLTCSLEATIYELRLPPENMSQLDAAALTLAAASPPEFDKALASVGKAKALYRMDQSVKLSGDRIMIGGSAPFVRATRLSETGRRINMVRYESVGAVLNIAGSSGPDGGISAELGLEMSAFTESAVNISAQRPARVVRKVVMGYKGMMRPGAPVVIVSADAASLDAEGKAVAYIARIVLGKRTIQPATQPAGALEEGAEGAKAERANRALIADAAREVGKPRVAVYLVINTTDTRLAEKAGMRELELAPHPLLRDEDFTRYDWEKHALELAAEARVRFPTPTSVWGMPYVVVIEGRRWYLGSYVPLVSSYMPGVPVAEIDPLTSMTKPIRIKTPKVDDIANPTRRASVAEALKSIGSSSATQPADKPFSPPDPALLDLDVLEQLRMPKSAKENQILVSALAATMRQHDKDRSRPTGQAPPLSRELARMYATRPKGSPPFYEVEVKAGRLAEEYTTPAEQGRIYAMVTHVYGQSGISPRTIHWAKKALEYPLDPRLKLRMYVYWGDATYLKNSREIRQGVGLAKREAALPYLLGIREALQYSLPDAKPELPAVGLFTVDPPDPALELKHRKQVQARVVALFVQDMIELRDVLMRQVASSQFPDDMHAQEKMRRVLKNPEFVGRLLLAARQEKGFQQILKSLISEQPATQPRKLEDAARTRVLQLIEQLGGDSFKERQAAQEALVKIGTSAIPALAAASTDKDPKRANGTKGALRQIIVAKVIASQARATSIRCVFTSKRLYRKGSLRVMDPDPMGGRSRSGTFPANDRVVETRHEVLIAGNRIRHDREGTLWHENVGEFQPNRQSGVLDGGIERMLYIYPTNKSGTIGRSSNILLELLELYPMRFAYRLFDPVLGQADAEKVRFVGFAEHGGYRCVVISQSREDGFELEHRWWLAEDQDYSVVRSELLGPGGSSLYCATMNHVRNDSGMWQLQSWDLRVGKAPYSSSEVVRLRVNESVEETAFDLPFPAGTRVTESTGGRGRRERRAFSSLVGKQSPRLDGLNVHPALGDIAGKRVLLCFWDMDQRPSRRCIKELAKRVDALTAKGVAVVTVHASAVEARKLETWLRANDVTLPVGRVSSDEKERKRQLAAWGVQSLPWLILTDKDCVVRAEGFGLSQLDEKLSGSAASVRESER